MEQKLADMLRLDNQLCFALYAASRKVTGAYGPLLKKLDLTYTQYVTLMVLWEQQELPVKDIGERLLLDSGTLTPLLKKLEEKGYVTRRRSTVDERVVQVRITHKGMDIQREVEAFMPDLICTIGLSTGEIADLREELKSLIRRMEA